MKHLCCRFPINAPVMSTIYLAILNDVVKSHGHSLKGCTSDQWHLADHRHRISPRFYLDVLRKTLAPTDLIGLGFEFGSRLNLVAAGPVGQLIMSAGTIEQALGYFLEYYPLLSLSMGFETQKNNQHLSIKVVSLYQEKEPDQVQWFVTETLVYSLLSNARSLSGKPLALTSLDLNYPAPPHAALYEKMIGCPVRFSQPELVATIDRGFSNQKVTTASYPIMLFKERQCRESLQRLRKCYTISEQIITILKRMQPVIPCQDTIAEQLNLSQSSLYRKLKEANTSYQKIVDRLRCEQALSYLNNTELSICEVADKLGFSDSSNFRRAFKKWTGLTPTELRGEPIAQEEIKHQLHSNQ